MNDIQNDKGLSASDHVRRDGLGRLAYSVSEAATVTGIGKTTLYSLISRGLLPSCKVGKRRIIRSVDLQALIIGGTNARI